jgi:hypothetical protein
MEWIKKMTFPDGSKLEGLFKNDLINGDGIFTSSNGREYEGKF